MPQQKSKKILIYISLFFIIATFNNKNFHQINFGKIDSISVEGLDEKNNFQLIENLNFLENLNIFLLDEIKIKRIIEANNLVEKYSVLKLYPSSLSIKIDKTNFVALFKKDGNNFLLGSNRKFIKTNQINKNLPFIFGDFDVESFFKLKNAMNETNFDFDEVINLFSFKSGRWDIETKYGLLIKLPKKEIKKSLENLQIFLEANDINKISKIDLRQSNQIIINE